MSNARNIASIAGEDVLNASNEIVPVYACRAWVNFNGTDAFSPNPSTSAIRDYGNVSSIFQNGTGEYTVNFEIPMPDANYVLTSSSNDSNSDRGFHVITIDYDESGVGTAPSTTSVKIINRVASSQTFSSTPLDCLNAMVAIFR